MIETGYSKLFSSLVTSTIWREDDKTRIVWITLLALKNRHGEVAGSVPGLAALANVSVQDCRAALLKLKSPDEDSRTKEFDGRRIQDIDGGWFVLNHDKYRDAMSEDQRREYQRKWQANYRKQISEGKRTPKQTVDTTVDTLKSTLTHADADADADATQTKAVSVCGNGSLKSWHPPELQRWFNTLFRRRDETKWSDKEQKALKAIGDVPMEDRAIVERYYLTKESPGQTLYRRKELFTLLNNFPGELDRARNFKPASVKPF